MKINLFLEDNLMKSMEDKEVPVRIVDQESLDALRIEGIIQ